MLSSLKTMALTKWTSLNGPGGGMIFLIFLMFCLGRKDGSFGKSFRSSCKTSSNQSTKPSGWTVGTSEQKVDEKKLSDHRLNSPQFIFLVGGGFFNPLNWKKTYAKAELVKLDPCPQGSGYFNLKWFPTTKSYIPICAQPSHVRFKTLMASSAVSQSHVTKPLLGTKTRAIRANLASLVSFWDGGGQKLRQTALGEEGIDVM